jgi:S-(hydroxymethyl)glutathione dehydrogenase/alcohol dehydrogenase
MIGSTMLDRTTRLRRGGETIYQLCGIASFAEEAVVQAGACVKVGTDVPLERACLLGCGVTTGAGAAFNTPEIGPGASVAVIGCGGVGLAAIQGARIEGAETIIAVDVDPAKLELAKTLGATHVVDGGEDVRKAIRAVTRLGVHVCIEAIGHVSTIETAWEVLRPGGLALVIGMPRASERIPLRAGGLFQERKIAGCVYGGADPHRDIPRLLDHVARGEFELDRLVSDELPLDRVQEALDDLAAGRGARQVIVNSG